MTPRALRLRRMRSTTGDFSQLVRVFCRNCRQSPCSAGNPKYMILPSSGTAGPGASLANSNFYPFIIGPACFFLTESGITSSTSLTGADFTDVQVGFGTGPDTTLGVGTGVVTPLPAAATSGFGLECGLLALACSANAGWPEISLLNSPCVVLQCLARTLRFVDTFCLVYPGSSSGHGFSGNCRAIVFLREVSYLSCQSLAMRLHHEGLPCSVFAAASPRRGADAVVPGQRFVPWPRNTNFLEW